MFRAIYHMAKILLFYELCTFFCLFYINHPVAHHILCPQAKKLQRNRFAALEGKKYARKG